MKQKLKKLMAILLVGMMVLSMTGCGETKKAEKTVANMFDALKDNDLEKARKYMDVESVEESMEDDDMDTEKLMKNIFENIEYDILSSEKVEKDVVEVTAEVTTINMKSFMQSYFAKALEYAFANLGATEEETEEKMRELMDECMEEAMEDTVTQEATMTVTKGEDGWKVEVDDELLNVILGGLPEATENLEADFVG